MTDYSKITALYSRLSVGDEDRDGGESNSIQNQKIFLENYARGQHLTNIRHYIDDDESGRFFDRSAYSRMMDDVENGKIGVCIMKDLTRWGRDYLQVGNAMEIFRRNNVRFIAVNNGIDSEKPDTLELANLYAGEYTVKQIMEAMLVPSGNDAAYVLAYHIAKNELGEGYTATEYIDYFMTELSEYLIEAGYSKTNLYNDPSGASMQADSHLDDINRVALKLLNYDFVKECIGKSEFSIQTPQGEFTWKNTNEFLDENSPYYNANVKGMKTGTMASSYNIVVLYEKDGKAYLITCLAAHSNEGRYKAVQSAINTIIE